MRIQKLNTSKKNQESMKIDCKDSNLEQDLLKENLEKLNFETRIKE